MKKIIFSSLFALMTFGLFAQTSDNPWYIGAGTSAISLQSDITGLSSTNVASTKDDLTTFNFDVPSLSVFRAIVGGLSVGGNLSLSSIKEKSGSNEIKYYSLDAILKYGFNRNGAVSPYIKGGWGLSSFDPSGNKTEFTNFYNPAASIGAETYIGGAGLNFKLGDGWRLLLKVRIVIRKIIRQRIIFSTLLVLLLVLEVAILITMEFLTRKINVLMYQD